MFEFCGDYALTGLAIIMALVSLCGVVVVVIATGKAIAGFIKKRCKPSWRSILSTLKDATVTLLVFLLALAMVFVAGGILIATFYGICWGIGWLICQIA